MGSPSRLAMPLAAALLGFLAVMAASEQTPARSARRLELVDLIREQDERVRELQREVVDLREGIENLAAETRGDELEELRARAAELAVAAGTAGLEGPGVVVTLDDSSASRSPTGDPNDLVVHERDLQAVVNALWGAGAEAVAINGERLTAASAVRCAGNTLLLHGAVHSPPYRIAAIGDAERLREGLNAQPGMERLLGAVSSFGLVYEVSLGEVRMEPVVPRIANAVAA